MLNQHKLQHQWKWLNNKTPLQKDNLYIITPTKANSKDKNLGIKLIHKRRPPIEGQTGQSKRSENMLKIH